MTSFYQYRTDALTSKVPKTNKCIVLDIDETLVHTYEEDNRFKLQELGLMEDPSLIDLRSRLYVLPLVDLSHTGDSTKSIYWGIMRPGLRDFLRFSSKYFQHVCIWSAGHKEYVEKVCTNIFRGIQRPTIIFSNNDCEKVGTHNIKPLTKMYSHPTCLGMSPENTLVLDDRSSTFSQNPLNGIQIPPYMPRDTVEGMRFEEPSLKLLMDWLLSDEVVNCPDIRNLEKHRIFYPNININGGKSPRIGLN